MGFWVLIYFFNVGIILDFYLSSALDLIYAFYYNWKNFNYDFEQKKNRPFYSVRGAI